LKLLIDIGNTNISAGLADKKKIIKKFYFDPGIIGRSVRKIDGAVIVSVNPSGLKKVLKVLRRLNISNIKIVGRNIKVPIRSLYDGEQIGQDRLVTAYAGARIYGTPAVIIDFGTAVTFDAISKDGVYLGGLIFPGIKMSLESLHDRTALLPEIELKKTAGFIGKNTYISISNGIVYGYAALCEGLIRKFRNVLGHVKVVVTGGNAELIKKHAKISGKIDKNLCLKGLLMLSSVK